jgi:hypothetical protein
VLGALWYYEELNDFLVGPLSDLRPKKVKQVFKKGKRSLKKKLDISSPLDKTMDAMDKARDALDKVLD